MATEEEVQETLHGLIRRLDDVDPSYRAMMPSKRTIEAQCPDLDLVYHAFWRNGTLSDIETGPSPRRPDIRISVDSDDLLQLANGDLDVGRAYANGRIRIQASMTDLLRLRAAL